MAAMGSPYARLDIDVRSNALSLGTCQQNDWLPERMGMNSVGVAPWTGGAYVSDDCVALLFMAGHVQVDWRFTPIRSHSANRRLGKTGAMPEVLA